MDKKSIATAAIVLGGGCLTVGISSLVITMAVMFGGAFMLNSCADKSHDRIKESEQLLERFTESELSDTMDIAGEFSVEKILATEYTPKDSRYGTVILENSQKKSMPLSVNPNLIAVTLDEKPITEDYFSMLEYGNEDVLINGCSEYLICHDYPELIYITPEGKHILTTEKDQEYYDSKQATSTQDEAMEYKISVSKHDSYGLFGLTDMNNEIVLNFEYDLISRITDNIYFLRKEQSSYFYNISTESFTEIDSSIENFFPVGEVFCAKASGEENRQYPVYTIYYIPAEN